MDLAEVERDIAKKKRDEQNPNLDLENANRTILKMRLFILREDRRVEEILEDIPRADQERPLETEDEMMARGQAIRDEEGQLWDQVDDAINNDDDRQIKVLEHKVFLNRFHYVNLCRRMARADREAPSTSGAARRVNPCLALQEKREKDLVSH